MNEDRTGRKRAAELGEGALGSFLEGEREQEGRRQHQWLRGRPAGAGAGAHPDLGVHSQKFRLGTNPLQGLNEGALAEACPPPPSADSELDVISEE